MAVPRLALDRPFTYLLPEDAGAGTGSLVSVPFHGRTVRAWILGPAAEVPPGRLLPIRGVRSPVRFFDPARLEKARNRIATAAAGIRARDYTARPSVLACTYCPFRDICPSSLAT